MNKTVIRLFTVLAVIIVICSIVSPLAFSLPVDTTPYDLPIDRSFQYLYKYFYGANSGIIDFKRNDGNKWYRLIINNQDTKATVSKSSNSFTLSLTDFNGNSLKSSVYVYEIGYSYSSGTSFSSSNWSIISNGSSMFYSLTNLPLVNSASAPIDTYGCSNSDLVSCDFNSYYPFYRTTAGSDQIMTTIVNNQEAESSANQSRYEAQQSEANSRQSQIMNEGSDITVSTIDNWIGGQNGLANKLTIYAATLSENAGRFSSNQAEVSSKLANAGAFVSGAFNKFPAVIVACMFCFLVILIAVKVVGR